MNDLRLKPNTVEGLLRAMPQKHKYLGTVNDAHFVLRKMVSVDNKNNVWRAYYEDEDTGEPVEGYEFEGSLFEVLNKLYIAINTEK